MYGKKYYISFIRVFALLYLGWSFIIIYSMFTTPTWENFVSISLAGIIVMGLLTGIIVLMCPQKINENGFIVVNQGPRTFFTKWEVINWNDIYGIKPTTIIFIHYIRIMCNGHIKPIWIPLSVINKSGLVEDLIRYVPDENPLKVYITTGKITQAVRPAQVEVLTNDKTPDIHANETFIKESLKAEHALKNGANWFYWIAALSLINTVIIVSGNDWNFVAGLSILQFVNVFAREITKSITPDTGTILMFFSITFDIIVAGIFIVFGYFANKRYKWSFIIGMILYALDMLISLAIKDFLSVAIHAIALLGIYGGLKAKSKLNELEKEKPKIDAVL